MSDWFGRTKKVGRERDVVVTAPLGSPRDTSLFHQAALVPRYQPRVLRSPSAREVVAFQPKRSRAREVSSLRRGWPLGWVVSQTMSPAKPVRARMVSARS